MHPKLCRPRRNSTTEKSLAKVASEKPARTFALHHRVKQTVGIPRQTTRAKRHVLVTVERVKRATTGLIMEIHDGHIGKKMSELNSSQMLRCRPTT